MRDSESVGDFAGAVLTAVIDNDDLKIIADALTHAQRDESGRFHVGFFVVAGEEDA